MKICIVGPSCAGKTTAAEYIESAYGIPFVEGSEVVWERYSESGSNEDIIEFVKEEYSSAGKATFAQPVIARAKEIEENHVVLSGFRTAEEVEHVQKQCNRVGIISIHANALLRYQRHLKRDPHTRTTYEEFIMKDFEEYNFGIARMMARFTDRLIINESTFSHLHSRCDDIMDGLLED